MTAAFAGPTYYNDCLGPLWFEPFAAILAGRVPQRPNGDVLEIACGTGLVTRRLRERLAGTVRLVAIDLSAAMLDYARSHIAAHAIEWHQADAQNLPFDDAAFAVVVSGFGIMFMDRQAALSEWRRVLRKGGLLAFNVWDRIENIPHALAIAQVVEALFPGDREMQFRAPYDMGDPDGLRALLARTGFRATRIERERTVIANANPHTVATGLVRGTPRAAMIEQRGVSLDSVIEKVAEALARRAGNPYNADVHAVFVEAVAI